MAQWVKVAHGKEGHTPNGIQEADKEKFPGLQNALQESIRGDTSSFQSASTPKDSCLPRVPQVNNNSL